VTGEHVIFIPGVLMIGMFLGFILGTRAARNQFDAAQKRADERDAAKAARAARKQKSQKLAETLPEDDG
jgi:hypothetical protein